MSMGKEQTVTAVVGGIGALAACVLGYFLWDAVSTKDEKAAELETAEADFQNFYRAAVFPSAKSIQSVKTNGVAYAAWLKEARALAAEGNKTFPSESAPAFKQRLSEEVRRLVNLPGGRDGKIAPADFLCGFDTYLGESAVLPPAADLPRLAAQLDTVSDVIETLSKAGIIQMVSVECVKPAAPKEDETNARGKRPAKKGAKAEGPVDSQLVYNFSFTTRPAGFVNALNALAAAKRFYVVDQLAVRESGDRIVETLNARDNPQGADNGGGRRRRRRAAEEDAPKLQSPADAAADRLVVDPEADAPLAVSFRLTVHDFGRAE